MNFRICCGFDDGSMAEQFVSRPYRIGEYSFPRLSFYRSSKIPIALSEQLGSSKTGSPVFAPYIIGEIPLFGKLMVVLLSSASVSFVCICVHLRLFAVPFNRKTKLIGIRLGKRLQSG